MELKDGERHIYANLESCGTRDSHGKASRHPHNTAATKPQVLLNTQMKNPGCLPKKKCTTKKETAGKQGKSEKASKVPEKYSRVGPGMADDGTLYQRPEINSTLQVATALAQARQMQPDVSRLLKDKLDSPTTAARLKKQPAQEVNVPLRRPVFRELVSLEVSKDSLDTQFRDVLNIRAAAVRPAPRPRDPVPQQSDILDPEEYVSQASVTTARCNYAPASCVQPQSLTRTELLAFSKMVMDQL
ncbi:hypothetical protein GWK47_026228 [Chionoecetes opilio]|nr:hypothetical protein GWK47_026228 [Chionoecetes opilio]